jgi:hypothetical protein
MGPNKEAAMSDDAHDEKSNKQSGAQNALKHGAFAKVFILPDEDQQAFRELRRSFRQDLKPDGALEMLYFTGVVQSAWTVIRVCRWIQRCHTLAEATYVRSAETDDDQGGKLTLIEQVAHQTATVSAMRAHRVTIQWLSEAVRNATDHLALNNLLRDIQKVFRVDALLLREEAAPADFTKRQELFELFIASELKPKVNAFIANELEEAGRQVRENIRRVVPIDMRAELECLARCHGEFDKAVRRFLQHRALRKTFNSLGGDTAQPERLLPGT